MNKAFKRLQSFTPKNIKLDHVFANPTDLQTEYIELKNKDVLVLA
jgi:hypothetical protein